MIETVNGGERFEAKYGRVGFRRNFPFEGRWQGKRYFNKQVEVYAVAKDDDWQAIYRVRQILLTEFLP